MDTMGQYAALQACFDIHQLGHASAYVQSGQFVLTDHHGIKAADILKGVRGAEPDDADDIGDREVVLRMCDASPQRLQFESIDTLRYELDAFADAIEGRAPFPVSSADMLATVTAFDAVIKALETGDKVVLAPA